MTVDGEYDSTLIKSFVDSLFQRLDKIKALNDDDYIDIKYLALFSHIDCLSGWLFPNEKSQFIKFRKLLTEFVSDDHFSDIDLYYFEVAYTLIGNEPKNPWTLSSHLREWMVSVLK